MAKMDGIIHEYENILCSSLNPNFSQFGKIVDVGDDRYELKIIADA